MHLAEQISPPPPGSTISLQQKPDRFILTGTSKGFPPGFLGEAPQKLALLLISKVTKGPTTDDHGVFYPKANTNWTIEITKNELSTSISNHGRPYTRYFLLPILTTIHEPDQQLLAISDNQNRRHYLTARIPTPDLQWLTEHLPTLISNVQSLPTPSKSSTPDLPKNFKLLKFTPDLNFHIINHTPIGIRIAITLILLTLVGFFSIPLWLTDEQIGKYIPLASPAMIRSISLVFACIPLFCLIRSTLKKSQFLGS